MADEKNGGEAKADAVENDPATDVHVEERTADSDDDLARGDQEGPRGARLIPGGGTDNDRTDEAREFVLAGDVSEDPTPQVDGTVVVSHLVATDRVTANGRTVYEVRPEVKEA